MLEECTHITLTLHATLLEYKTSSKPVLKEYFSGSKLQMGVARINKSSQLSFWDKKT